VRRKFAFILGRRKLGLFCIIVRRSYFVYRIAYIVYRISFVVLRSSYLFWQDGQVVWPWGRVPGLTGLFERGALWRLARIWGSVVIIPPPNSGYPPPDRSRGQASRAQVEFWVFSIEHWLVWPISLMGIIPYSQLDVK